MSSSSCSIDAKTSGTSALEGRFRALLEVGHVFAYEDEELEFPVGVLGCDARAVHSPFPRPSSIKLLALRPRMPELLRRCPFSALPLRISLLRLMTGVSAKGS